MRSEWTGGVFSRHDDDMRAFGRSSGTLFFLSLSFASHDLFSSVTNMSKTSAPEKTLAERQEREYADGTSDTTQVENKLPENAPLDANGMLYCFSGAEDRSEDGMYKSIGCPTFAGMSGNKLIWAFTAVSSCGFTLFGFVVVDSRPVIAILILRQLDTIKE